MDAWLTRLYARLGTGYIVPVLLLAALPVCSTIAIAILIATRFLHLDTSEFLVALIAVEAVVPVTAGVALYALRRELRLLMAWVDGDIDRAESADALWQEMAQLPRRVGRIVFVVGATLALPAALISLMAPIDYGALDFAIVSTFVVLVSAGNVTYVRLSFEIALRPVMSEIAPYVERDTASTGPSERFAPKIIIGLTALVLLSALLSSLLFADSRTPDKEILIDLILAFGTVVMISLPLTVALAAAILGPVGDLMRGTEAIASGNLDMTIPVGSGDELGTLAASFNRMVDGLSEREVLRSHNEELIEDVRRHAEELSASRARIVAASDEARRRVERDLHDGAQQNLVLLNLKLGLAVRKFDSDPHEALAIVEESRAELERALAELRDLAHGIYPAVLSSDGLPGALAEIATDSVLTTEFDAGGAGRYPPEIEAAVFFCCLEAIQNASKYAGDGATVRIALRAGNSELLFEVADDGPGFDPASVNGSAGLQNMADRIGALGGELRLESAPGEGTRVLGRVPVPG